MGGDGQEGLSQWAEVRTAFPVTLMPCDFVTPPPPPPPASGPSALIYAL